MSCGFSALKAHCFHAHVIQQTQGMVPCPLDQAGGLDVDVICSGILGRPTYSRPEGLKETAQFFLTHRSQDRPTRAGFVTLCCGPFTHHPSPSPSPGTGARCGRGSAWTSTSGAHRPLWTSSSSSGRGRGCSRPRPTGGPPSAKKISRQPLFLHCVPAFRHVPVAFVCCWMKNGFGFLGGGGWRQVGPPSERSLAA